MKMKLVVELCHNGLNVTRIDLGFSLEEFRAVRKSVCKEMNFHGSSGAFVSDVWASRAALWT